MWRFLEWVWGKIRSFFQYIIETPTKDDNSSVLGNLAFKEIPCPLDANQKGLIIDCDTSGDELSLCLSDSPSLKNYLKVIDLALSLVLKTFDVSSVFSYLDFASPNVDSGITNSSHVKPNEALQLKVIEILKQCILYMNNYPGDKFEKSIEVTSQINDLVKKERILGNVLIALYNGSENKKVIYDWLPMHLLIRPLWLPSDFYTPCTIREIEYFQTYKSFIDYKFSSGLGKFFKGALKNFRKNIDQDEITIKILRVLGEEVSHLNPKQRLKNWINLASCLCIDFNFFVSATDIVVRKCITESDLLKDCISSVIELHGSLVRGGGLTEPFTETLNKCLCLLADELNVIENGRSCDTKEYLDSALYCLEEIKIAWQDTTDQKNTKFTKKIKPRPSFPSNWELKRKYNAIFSPALDLSSRVSALKIQPYKEIGDYLPYATQPIALFFFEQLMKSDPLRSDSDSWLNALSQRQDFEKNLRLVLHELFKKIFEVSFLNESELAPSHKRFIRALSTLLRENKRGSTALFDSIYKLDEAVCSLSLLQGVKDTFDWLAATTQNVRECVYQELNETIFKAAERGDIFATLLQGRGKYLNIGYRYFFMADRFAEIQAPLACQDLEGKGPGFYLYRFFKKGDEPIVCCYVFHLDGQGENVNLSSLVDSHAIEANILDFFNLHCFHNVEDFQEVKGLSSGDIEALQAACGLVDPGFSSPARGLYLYRSTAIDKKNNVLLFAAYHDETYEQLNLTECLEKTGSINLLDDLIESWSEMDKNFFMKTRLICLDKVLVSVIFQFLKKSDNSDRSGEKILYIADPLALGSKAKNVGSYVVGKEVSLENCIEIFSENLTEAKACIMRDCKLEDASWKEIERGFSNYISGLNLIYEQRNDQMKMLCGSRGFIPWAEIDSQKKVNWVSTLCALLGEKLIEEYKIVKLSLIQRISQKDFEFIWGDYKRFVGWTHSVALNRLSSAANEYRKRVSPSSYDDRVILETCIALYHDIAPLINKDDDYCNVKRLLDKLFEELNLQQIMVCDKPVSVELNRKRYRYLLYDFNLVTQDFMDASIMRGDIIYIVLTNGEKWTGGKLKCQFPVKNRDNDTIIFHTLEIPQTELPIAMRAIPQGDGLDLSNIKKYRFDILDYLIDCQAISRESSWRSLEAGEKSISDVELKDELRAIREQGAKLEPRLERLEARLSNTPGTVFNQRWVEMTAAPLLSRNASLK